MKDKNYYEILGVDPAATFREIKRAFRQLAKRYHPDKRPDSTAADRETFSRAAEAYAVLSNLKKRKAYDDFLFNRQKPQGGFEFTRPHYSGYPYFQYDIFTPFFHSFFMGRGTPPKTRKEQYRAAFLNYRVLLVSALGALFFFKFFTAMEGTVVEKKIRAGWFHNISHYLILKTTAGGEIKKRVKAGLYEQVRPTDRIKKSFFSFTYVINGEEITPVDVPRFLTQMGMIYAVLSGGLFLLEYGRK
ncbi:MAG: DnaJ domain-containing protein [Nitrospinales bacterium]